MAVGGDLNFTRIDNVNATSQRAVDIFKAKLETEIKITDNIQI